MDYLNYDFAELQTRDTYRTPEEIDLRRRAELLNLVDRWKTGEIDFWRVMYDLTFIMDKWHESAFSNTMENSRGYFK